MNRDTQVPSSQGCDGFIDRHIPRCRVGRSDAGRKAPLRLGRRQTYRLRIYEPYGRPLTTAAPLGHLPQGEVIFENYSRSANGGRKPL